MSESEEECEDDIRRRQLVENSEHVVSEDEDIEVVRMVTECLARYNNYGESNYAECNDGINDGEDVPAIGGDVCEEEDLTDVLRESKIPLYEGARSTRLVAVLLLLNCFTVFGVSNACADEILKVVSELLPPGNNLPRSNYEGKKFLRMLGLSYDSIHACRNGCCLFRKQLADALYCPKCGQMRYTSENSKRAMKVLRHFPLIPRLQRMYRCSRLAELSKWHATRRGWEGNIECVPDCKAWKHVDTMYPEFGSSERNIRLGMALDGVNPFSTQSLSHSTWPVVLLNYNLPPWLVTKRFFFMLALLIPGKESVTSENIDVYLAPLIEELQELWSGVDAVDVSGEHGKRNFKLKAILMWCIHDYPAYGLVSGQVTKGYKGCTECGPNVTTRRSAALGKNLFLGHRRYLSMSHPYRTQGRAFDGTEEWRAPPCPLTGQDIMRHAQGREMWLNASRDNKPGGENDPVHQTGVKRLSALYALPYWQVSDRYSMQILCSI